MQVLDISEYIKIPGQIGYCGKREVFLGFATAKTLYRYSFADVLDEETGEGYQRRFSEAHSLDFRKFIHEPGSTTIPLTFNLRGSGSGGWSITKDESGDTYLLIRKSSDSVLAQVDCQHRIGFLADSDVSFAFMAFIGLSMKEEMQVFNVINGKAKGLSNSLLDYHDAQLSNDLARERPELYISLRLNDEIDSVWYRRLDLGGNQTSGLKRKASLRTMQKSVKRFLNESSCLSNVTPDVAFNVLSAFWKAISTVLYEQWIDPRKHYLTKGIGVYSLSSLASDLYLDARPKTLAESPEYFEAELSKFMKHIDWSTNGVFAGLGGESGVSKAIEIIRRHRLTTGKMKVV